MWQCTQCGQWVAYGQGHAHYNYQYPVPVYYYPQVVYPSTSYDSRVDDLLKRVNALEQQIRKVGEIAETVTGLIQNAKKK